eukprot:SAG11_NODE_11315_length_769_cov_0.800000_1_plen_191_part_10
MHWRLPLLALAATTAHSAGGGGGGGAQWRFAVGYGAPVPASVGIKGHTDTTPQCERGGLYERVSCKTDDSLFVRQIDPAIPDGLTAAFNIAAVAPQPMTIHLLPGRHVLRQPLVLDHRHSGTRLVGHNASVSGAVRVGDPHDGGQNISGWVVVGPAKCAGCTEIWKAKVPPGADSRQFWVNGRRANRTWIR